MSKSLEALQKEIAEEFDAGRQEHIKETPLSKEEIKLFRKHRRRRLNERYQILLHILDKKEFTSIKYGILPAVKEHLGHIPYNGLRKTLLTMKKKGLIDKNYKPINDNWQ